MSFRYHPPSSSPKLNASLHSLRIGLLPAIMALSLGLSPPARAAEYYWDVNGSTGGLGGTGAWNTTASNRVWNDATGTSVSSPWTAGNTPVFTGTAGTVTLSSGQTASNLRVEVDGYVLAGNAATANLLTVSGASEIDGALTLQLNATGSTGTGRHFITSSLTGDGAVTLRAASGGSAENIFYLSLTDGATVSVPITIDAAGHSDGAAGIRTENGASATLTGGITTSSLITTMISAYHSASSPTVGLTLQGAGISGSGNVQFGDYQSSGTTPRTGGAATVFLNVASTYTGSTLINSSASGTVKLGVTNALPTGTALTVSRGTLNLAGHDQQVASLSGSMAANAVVTSDAAGSDLHIGTISGYTSFAGLISGSLALHKYGNSIQELTAANTYTGGTFITGGVLVANNDPGAFPTASATGFGSVTVSGTGTLAGTGRVAGDVLLWNDATLMVGNTAGDITGVNIELTGSLTSHGTLQFDIMGTTGGTGDQLLLTSRDALDTISLSGILKVRSDQPANSLVDGATWKLIDWSTFAGTGRPDAWSDLSDWFQLDLPELTNGHTWEVYGDSSGLYLLVAPEPSSSLLLMAGLSTIIFTRRRRSWC